MADGRIEMRVSPALRVRIEELAAERKCSMTEAIKWAVLKATSTGEGIATEQENLELLSEAARTGSVPAMKELRAHHRERNSDPQETPLGVVDELAEKRAA
jgi:hypothetical protein